MRDKILVIALGGTIGSTKDSTIHLSNNPLKIIDYCKYENVSFECASPFVILSENIDKSHWQKLIDFLENVDFESYKGVIILHGSDTLSYTSSIIGNAYPDENIVFVAANKPIEDEKSNGISNFNMAVEHILNNSNGVFVSYDGIKKATSITSADINDEFREIKSINIPSRKKKISTKNVLIIKSYPTLDIKNYNFRDVDEVLIEMYHSATVPPQIVKYLISESVNYHFVTHKPSADYETAKNIDNSHIIFNSTIENAYAKIILE